jgi:hypothetical protein
MAVPKCASFEQADGGMERIAPALWARLAVPAAVFELLALELSGLCVVRFLEIRIDAEDSTVNAGLRLSMK